MIEVTWQAEDGYCGGSRPHTIKFDDDEVEDMDAEERQEFIENAVQEEFEQTVTWEITNIEETED